MTLDAVVGVVTVGVTLALATTGAAVWVCVKLEKINVTLANLVTHDQCSARRHHCPALRESAGRKRKISGK